MMTTMVKAAAAAGLFAAALVVSWTAFFFFRDNFSTHYPMKVISAEVFRSGEIPWWNFHDFGGQPLAGNPNSLTFYPDNVLYLFLPAHVAFNLHFLIHLAAGFAAMRALCLLRTADRRASTVAALVWTLSGVVVSSAAFYNLVTASALIPLALLAVEKRSARLLGCAFGLLLLGSEPMTIAGTALVVAIAGAGRMTLQSFAVAFVMAIAIGSPQLVAYSEIAGEVERSVPLSPGAVLATSLTPARVAEIFLWPVHGFLNDAGGLRQRLFSTIFIGVIALPALFARSRHVVGAAVCLFFALGHNNPVVEAMVSALPTALRVIRYPEKLVLPLTACLVVLIAGFIHRTRFRNAAIAIAIVPLLWTTWRALPIDWFDRYEVDRQPPLRVHWNPSVVPGAMPARLEYRARAKNLDWMFGAVANVRYAIGLSPDRMHALLSRAVAERFGNLAPELKQRYLRMNAADVPHALPMAVLVPATVGAASLSDAIRIMESPQFDEHRVAVAPVAFRSAAGRVVAYQEDGQTIRVNVEAEGPALLMVNQTYFQAWVARSGESELETLPLNADRLGILVPGGTHEVTLTFGRRRGGVVVCWILSIALLIGSALAPLVEKLNRRPREVERSADENRADI
jgi:hypothetical protein